MKVRKSKLNAHLFLLSHHFAKKIERFDLTLSSHNFGLKDDGIKTNTISETAGRQLSYSVPWIPQNSFATEKKPFAFALWTISTGNQ